MENWGKFYKFEFNVCKEVYTIEIHDKRDFQEASSMAFEIFKQYGIKFEDISYIALYGRAYGQR